MRCWSEALSYRGSCQYHEACGFAGADISTTSSFERFPRRPIRPRHRLRHEVYLKPKAGYRSRTFSSSFSAVPTYRPTLC